MCRTAVAFVCLVLSSFAYAQQTGQFDVRQSRWGMTSDQVRQSEPDSPVIDTPANLAYTAKVVGIDSLAIFFFEDGKLVSFGYTFMQQHSNDKSVANLG
jgi:hypothetical protein